MPAADTAWASPGGSSCQTSAESELPLVSATAREPAPMSSAARAQASVSSALHSEAASTPGVTR